MKFKSLGKKGSTYHGLETFKKPDGCFQVSCISDEVTALCPVTGAPDWYTITVSYEPKDLCVESKSLKLFLQSFRNEGMFCEALSDVMALQLSTALKCCVVVKIVKKARGGVSI